MCVKRITELVASLDFYDLLLLEGMEGDKMKKIKIFKNHEEYCVNPSGSSYIKVTWAQTEAEKFINRNDIKVLSIKYAGGRDDAIMIVYKEIK